MSEVGDGIIQGLEEVVEFLDGKRTLKQTLWVEVIRCKDCRNFHKVDEAGFGRCYEHDSYGKDGDYWYMDDFCSYGERKNEIN